MKTRRLSALLGAMTTALVGAVIAAPAAHAVDPPISISSTFRADNVGQSDQTLSISMYPGGNYFYDATLTPVGGGTAMTLTNVHSPLDFTVARGSSWTIDVVQHGYSTHVAAGPPGGPGTPTVSTNGYYGAYVHSTAGTSGGIDTSYYNAKLTSALGNVSYSDFPTNPAGLTVNDIEPGVLEHIQVFGVNDLGSSPPATADYTPTALPVAFRPSLIQSGVTFTRPTTDTPPKVSTTNANFQPTSFDVTVAGSYEIGSFATFDSIVCLYRNAFDPTQPLANVITCSEGSYQLGAQTFTESLTPGRYVYVLTSYTGGVVGSARVYATGPAPLQTYTPGATTATPLTMLALLPSPGALTAYYAGVAGPTELVVVPTAGGPAKIVTSTKSPITVSGLTNGVAYTVYLIPEGGVPPTSGGTAATPGAKTALAFTLPKPKHTGVKVKATGKVTAAGKPLGSVSVVLERIVKGKLKPVATAKTNKTGAVTFSFKPVSGAVYELVLKRGPVTFASAHKSVRFS